MNQHKACKSPVWMALLLAGLVSHPCLAADSEDLYFGSLPVVASVSRLPQPLSEAPASVTVIDRDMIRSSGVRNFADLLRLVPGFQVTPPNQEGAIVGYHGLSNAVSSEEYMPRVQVLVDGRTQYSPLFRSGVNWNLLPVSLDDIDRVEVIRGSNTVSYGSNAFLGVINIITLDASQTKGWLVSANHGNQSIRDENLRWGGSVGAADVRLTYRRLGDGGVAKMFDGSLGWFDPHDSRHAQLVDLRADMPLTEEDELRLSLGQAYDVSQFGRPAIGLATGNLGDPFRDLSQSSTYFNTEWRRAQRDGQEMKLRYSHVEDWASGRFVERVGSFTQADNTQSGDYFSQNETGGRSASDELDYQHILSPGASTRLVWGANVLNARVSSLFQFSNPGWKERTSSRLFGNLEWRAAPQWVFNFGSSLQRDTLGGTMVDPRVSASYHVTPENTLRVIASRAHRTPSLYEALGDTRKTPIGAANPIDRIYFAAPGLKPERIDALEAGYLGEFKSLRASLDVRWFHESIPNRIIMVPYALPPGSPDDREPMFARLGILPANPVGSPYPFGRADAAVNLEQVSIQGYEYQWRWQPTDTTRLMYGHAFIRMFANLTDESRVADSIPDGQIAKISNQTRHSAPRHSSTAMLVQRLPYNVEASVMYFKSGYMRWLRNSETSPSERIDWRLARSFRIGGTRMEVAYVSQYSNHDQPLRRNTRVASETHWLSLRMEY